MRRTTVWLHLADLTSAESAAELAALDEAMDENREGSATSAWPLTAGGSVLRSETVPNLSADQWGGFSQLLDEALELPISSRSGGHRRIPHRRHAMHGNQKTLAFLIATGALASALPLQAQTQRQATTGAAVERLDATAAQRLIEPLEVEVEELRNEVRRLQAALKSLALTVNANQSAYAKHRHGVASYGMTNVKSIVPNTPAIEGTMLVITTAAGPAKGQTGLPE